MKLLIQLLDLVLVGLYFCSAYQHPVAQLMRNHTTISLSEQHQRCIYMWNNFLLYQSDLCSCSKSIFRFVFVLVYSYIPCINLVSISFRFFPLCLLPNTSSGEWLAIIQQHDTRWILRDSWVGPLRVVTMHGCT